MENKGVFFILRNLNGLINILPHEILITNGTPIIHVNKKNKDKSLPFNNADFVAHYRKKWIKKGYELSIEIKSYENMGWIWDRMKLRGGDKD